MSLSGVSGQVVVNEGDDVVSQRSAEDAWEVDLAGNSVGIAVGKHRDGWSC